MAVTLATGILAIVAQADASEIVPIDTPSVDWPSLVPFLILAVGGLLMLTVSSLAKGLPSWAYSGATAVIAASAGISTIPLWIRVEGDGSGALSTLDGAFGFDRFGLFAAAVIAAGASLAALLSWDYLRREGLEGVEYYVLLLLSASGGVVMAAANDLIVVFLGLEILSIAVYVLAALHLRRIQSQEAGLKYFVLGAFSSAFFLYGIALVYGATGSTNLAVIKNYLASTVLADDALLLGGFALLLVGFGFKIAAVPFHAWTPDVYQGAPSPVVAFMASVVKVAAFAALMRVFVEAFGAYADDWQPAIYGLAVVTLVVGSVRAVAQTDVKRMLAFSSISHAGFILLGVQAATDRGVAASLFYLAVYTFMTVGSFGVITLVGRDGDHRHDLDDYRGLAKNRPALALGFTILLLAQAGVPFTAGFMAKFEVIGAAVDARSYPLAIVAMVSAVVAAFLYLRIVVAMYLDDGDGGTASVVIPFPAGLAIAISVVVTIAVGLYPGPLDELARDAIPRLVAAG